MEVDQWFSRGTKTHEGLNSNRVQRHLREVLVVAVYRSRIEHDEAPLRVHRCAAAGDQPGSGADSPGTSSCQQRLLFADKEEAKTRIGLSSLSLRKVLALIPGRTR